MKLLIPLLLLAASARAADTIVSLTFDDGSADQMNALSALDSHGFKGTFYINSAQLGTSSFYLTRAQLDQIKASGHEIAGHTLNHLHLTTLSTAQAQQEICDDRQNLINWGYGTLPSFAYPFGEYNSSVENIAKNCGYTSARIVGGLSCASCPDAGPIPPPDKYAIVSPDSIKDTNSLASIEQIIIDAENSGGGWVPMVFHRICVGCGEYSTTPTILNGFLDWLKTRPSTTKIKTVAEVMNVVASTGTTPPPPPPPPPSGSAFFEPFNYPNGVIASETGTPASSTWTVYGGTLRADNGTGWTGGVEPFFRAVTKRSDFGDVSVSFSLTKLALGTTGTGAWDGVQVALRFQDENNHYFINISRRDNTVKIKEKRNGTETQLASAAFTFPLNAAQTVRADAVNQTGGGVLLRLFVNGTQLLSFTDTTPFSAPGAVGVFGDNANFRFDDFTVAPFGTSTAPVNALPVLTAISPSTATAGSPDLTLTATGTGFVSSSTVRWNGAVRPTTFVNSTTLRALIAASDLFAPTTAQITVFTPAPGGGTSAAKNFVVNAVPGNPVPILVSVNPSSAVVGGADFTLTAFGSGFLSSSTVRWNGGALATTFVSGSTLSATVPSADIVSTGTAQVTVFTPGPGGGTSTAKAFSIILPPNPAPVLSSIDPSTATAGSPGFPISLSGSDFIAGSSVRWNGAPRTTGFVSSTTLTAVIPASDLASPATAQVTVFNPGPGGGTSTAKAFVINPSTSAPPAVGLYSDNFNRANALITNEYAFWNPNDNTSVISGTWTVTAGSLFVNNNTAWTGVPDANEPNATSSNATGSAVFRARTKRNNFQDVAVSFTLTNQGFVTTSATPAAAWDGVGIDLRYQSETSYYLVKVNRRDNTIALKKKAGSSETALASASYAPSINVPQSIRAMVKNNGGTSVTLTLFINGTQRVTFTDSSSPILAQGAVGFRADNVNFRFDDFLIESLSGTTSLGLACATCPPPPPPPPLTPAPVKCRPFPNPWRGDQHSGLPVTLTNLSPTADVKIYTVSGSLVKELPSSGGTAKWDLRNTAGTTVSSGLYIYMTTDEDGERRRGVMAIVR